MQILNAYLKKPLKCLENKHAVSLLGQKLTF